MCNACYMSAFASVPRFVSKFSVFVCLCLCVCVSAHAVFMNILPPSQGECGWFGDSKCMVPQSLRPLNYLSSSHDAKVSAQS